MGVLKMPNILKDQKGFSFIEVLLVLAVIGAIAYAGVYFVGRQDDATNTDSSVTPATSQEAIKTTQELDEVGDSLNDINLDSLDTTELDAAEADLL